MRWSSVSTKKHFLGMGKDTSYSSPCAESVHCHRQYRLIDTPSGYLDEAYRVRGPSFWQSSTPTVATTSGAVIIASELKLHQANVKCLPCGSMRLGLVVCRRAAADSAAVWKASDINYVAGVSRRRMVLLH
jgi:hypothetical protein